VVDGSVSSTAFFRAFEVGSIELREQADATESTVGQALMRIANSLVTVVGEFGEASGASAHMAGTISDLADALDRFDAAGFAAKIQSIAEAFWDTEEGARAWLAQLANAQAFADLSELLRPYRVVQAVLRQPVVQEMAVRNDLHSDIRQCIVTARPEKFDVRGDRKRREPGSESAPAQNKIVHGQMFTGCSPKQRSQQVRRISARRERFRASWRRGRFTAPPA